MRVTSAVLGFLLVGATLPAQIFYVAPGGNDLWPGSEAQPWATVQKAASTLVAGQTAYVKAGTYPETVICANSGSAGAYITYSAFPGDVVTIDGAGKPLPSWGAVFDMSDRDYIRVTGLRVVNSTVSGIVADTCNHIVIENNHTSNTVNSGISVWNVSDVLVAGNDVGLACNDSNQECITIGGTTDFEVRGNHVHHGGPGTLGGEGIDAKDGSSSGVIWLNHVHHLNRMGIYVDAWDKHTFNIQVFRNIVHDCVEDGMAVASENGGLLENIRIFNNVVYNNSLNGLTVAGWGEPVPSHPLKDITIVNNTFYGNGAIWGGGVSFENLDSQNVVVRNNICSQNVLAQIWVEAGAPPGSYVVDHNLIDGFRGETGEIRGSDYVEGVAGFLNAGGADFHLRSDSPAIDRGSSSDAAADDYDGRSRPAGAAHDIGAFEYRGGPFGSSWQMY